MTKGWEPTPLGDLLMRSERIISINPLETYKQVTVRLWGQGVLLRDEVPGSEISAAKRYEVKTGQFILSKIDARNGAFGLVPVNLDGAVVSGDFPVFDINLDQLEPKFLEWKSKTGEFVDLCRAASEGTTNRVRLKEDKFLRLKFTLPTLPMQRRIIAKIEALAANIERAYGLRREASMEASLLHQSRMNRIFDRIASKHPVKTFGSFDHHVTSGPRYWGGDKYSEKGFRFYRAQDIGPDARVLNESKVYVIPPEGKQGRTAQLAPGDLMIVITGATVGRCSLFSEGLEPGFVSQHVALCRLPKNEVEPKYALWCLVSPFGQNQLLGQRYGQGKPGLNLTNIRNIEIPLPPINEQRRVVAYLDGLQAQVDTLKNLQAQTAAELDALLPAILDRAFKGEL